MSMTRNDSKAIDVFKKAVEYCDFQNIQACEDTDEYAKALVAYDLFDDDDKNIATIALSYFEDAYYFAISTMYYAYYAKIMQFDMMIFAYAIRNATKVVCKPNDTNAFFVKFFMHHPEYCNQDELESRMNETMSDDIDMTYVNAEVFDLNSSKHLA